MTEALDNGPDFLDIFSPELFQGLVDHITAIDNNHFMIRLKNGLELPETLNLED